MLSFLDFHCVFICFLVSTVCSLELFKSQCYLCLSFYPVLLMLILCVDNLTARPPHKICILSKQIKDFF